MADFDFDRLEKMIAELVISDKETKERFKETEAILKKNAEEILASNKKADKVLGQFTTMWGKLVEGLVEGQLIPMLRERGIDVHETSQRRKGNHEGMNFEFDIIAHNGNEIVITEVKTTLTISDVKDFIKKLKNARIWLKEFSNFKVLGAVAFLHSEGSSDNYAMNNGLFAIKATGNSSSIINEDSFKPRSF